MLLASIFDIEGDLKSGLAIKILIYHFFLTVPKNKVKSDWPIRLKGELLFDGQA